MDNITHTLCKMLKMSVGVEMWDEAKQIISVKIPWKLRQKRKNRNILSHAKKGRKQCI